MKIGKIVRPALVVVSVIALILFGFLGYQAWNKSHTIIPPAIKKQVSFVIFWPNNPTVITNDKSTIKYDPGNKFISFVSTTKDGAKIIISQEATPESFNDIPKVYDKFIEQLQKYGSFDSDNGKVYLVHPKELKGGQTAIMNSKGTLLFMRPDKDLSDDTWKQIFNNLDLIH